MAPSRSAEPSLSLPASRRRRSASKYGNGINKRWQCADKARPSGSPLDTPIPGRDAVAVNDLLLALVSTTHVAATGSIIGTGLGKRGAEVRWNVAGRMATAWVFTLPCAAAVGAGAEFLAKAIHGSPGVIVVLIILAAIAGTIYWRSRKNKVDHTNVNEESTGSVAPAEPETAAAA